MRNLKVVIELMLVVIPEDEVILRKKFLSLISSIVCTAPELMVERWKQAHEIMCSVLTFDGEQVTGWKLDMVNIFTGKEK